MYTYSKRSCKNMKMLIKIYVYRSYLKRMFLKWAEKLEFILLYYGRKDKVCGVYFCNVIYLAFK